MYYILPAFSFHLYPSCVHNIHPDYEPKIVRNHQTFKNRNFAEKNVVIAGPAINPQNFAEKTVACGSQNEIHKSFLE